MNKNTKNKEENIELRGEEFQEILGSIPPWILRWGITSIGVILLFLLVGSALFSYPDIINSKITLTGTTPAVEIVARTTGKIKNLYVTNDQKVLSGDYLSIIENPASEKDIFHLKEYLLSIDKSKDSIISIPPDNMNLGNIQSLYTVFYMALSDYKQFNQTDYHLKKIDFMKDRIKRNKEYYSHMLLQQELLKNQQDITYKQYSRDSILHKSKLLADEELETAYSKHLQGILSLENMNSTLENIEIQIEQMHENLLDTEYQYIDRKNTLENQIQSYRTQLLAEIQSWELNYILSAPIRGTITFTNYWTENQNITVGETVFNIIPDDSGELIGKALLPSTRSGKVQIGQKVNIRFNNFPDEEFGMIKGIVSNISQVPYKTEGVTTYVVEISLPDGLTTNYKKALPYLPNMEGQADIITKEMSLLERFILPIKKILSESL